MTLLGDNTKFVKRNVYVLGDYTYIEVIDT